MFIRQVSIFLENVKGSLRELTELLGKNDINLLALCIADTSGFGIVRCIVKGEDVDRSVDILRKNGYISKVNSVICIRVPHRPLGLSNVLNILEQQDIAVEYAYSFCRSTLDDAVVIIRPSDKDKCLEILQKNSINLVTQDELDMF